MGRRPYGAVGEEYMKQTGRTEEGVRDLRRCGSVKMAYEARGTAQVISACMRFKHSTPVRGHAEKSLTER